MFCHCFVNVYILVISSIRMVYMRFSREGNHIPELFRDLCTRTRGIAPIIDNDYYLKLRKNVAG